VDDIAVVGESDEDSYVSYNMLKKVNDTLKEHYMKINQRKTKILICIKQPIYANITLDGILLETVQSITYPGSKSQAMGKAIRIRRVCQKNLPYYFKKQ
jgi:hypothetical protein